MKNLIILLLTIGVFTLSGCYTHKLCATYVSKTNSQKVKTASVVKEPM